MPQSLSAIYLHAVFSTRDRIPFLHTSAQREKMFSLIAGISYRLDAPPVIVGGMPDHVHVLFTLPRTLAPSDWIKEIKRASTLNWKKEDDPAGDFSWQHGYGMFSVSPSQLARVEAYIKNQQSHHQAHDFQAEFRALLKRHKLAWDEKHVWA